MERLLVIKLDVLDCDAEVLLNGIPVSRADAGRPRTQRPIHEYTVAGVNRLELVIWPRPPQAAATAPLPPVRRVSDGRRRAQVHVLLPRIGQPADESSARTLAQLNWMPDAGEAYEAPLRLTLDVELPVSFPRWRWLDAPPTEVTAATQAQVHALITALAVDLAQGSTERLIDTARLRTEELALAYQRQPEIETRRLREWLTALHTENRLKWLPLEPEALHLRPLAGGRLLDCLDAAGLPALRTDAGPQGPALALPLRISSVQGRLYVLR